MNIEPSPNIPESTVAATKCHEVDLITSWFGYFLTSAFYFVLLGIKTPLECLLRRSPGPGYCNQATFWSVILTNLSIVALIPLFVSEDSATVVRFVAWCLILVFVARMIQLQVEFALRERSSPAALHAKYPGQSVFDLLLSKGVSTTATAPTLLAKMALEPLVPVLLAIPAAVFHPVLSVALLCVALSMAAFQLLEIVLKRT